MRLHKGWDESSFCMFFRGIELAIEVFGTSSPIPFYNVNIDIIMNIDIIKAKRALATLKEEKQAQQYRLQLAAQAKRELDNNRHVSQFRSKSVPCKEK